MIDWWYLYLTHFFSKRPSPLHGLHVYHVFAHWVPLEQVIPVYFQFVRLPSHYVSAKEFICVKLTLYLMLSHAGWYCLLLNSQSSASLNLSNMARTFHKNLPAFNIFSEICVSQVNKIFKQEPDLFVTNSLAILNYSRQIRCFSCRIWCNTLVVFITCILVHLMYFCKTFIGAAFNCVTVDYFLHKMNVLLKLKEWFREK